MPMLAALLAVVMMGLPQTTQVSGKVLDRLGQPVVGATVIYTHTEVGRVYKFKTNKKGEFSGNGLIYGVYQIQINTADGTHLYHTQRKIVDPNTIGYREDTNTLTADLSLMAPTDTASGVDANVLPGDIRPGDKLTPQQKDLIRAENIRAARINDLIQKLHTALDARDWPTATDVLHQLIAADPNRWEFYQNLGTVQAGQAHYQEAVESYEKGIEVAQSTIARGPDPAGARKEISLMMIYAGDAYSHTGNNEKAVAMYMKAAEISSEPATAYLNICRAQQTNAHLEEAAAACEKAISADPNRWEPYQIIGSLEQNAEHNQEAITSYGKGIEVAQKAISAGTDVARAKVALGQMLSAQGNLYVHDKKFEEAIGFFQKAVEVDAYPALDYFNICAAYYDINNHESALEACNKAIESDPKMADPYFVKASMLYSQGKVEHGRFNAPPAASEALTKYLELDPNGPRAATAKEMLQHIGAEVETTYKARKKAASK